MPRTTAVLALAMALATGLAGLAGCSPSAPEASAAGAATAAAAAPQRFSDRLADGSAGPPMVEIPGGRFSLGSPAREADRLDNEGPQREVTLAGFALGMTEVSRSEFGAFVRATGHVTDAERNTATANTPGTDGCFTIGTEAFKPDWYAGTSWRDPGYAQGEDHPVACVSWNDAQAYIEWLRRETGKRYRLPSEAELEYAIRAGSSSPWAWGADPDAGCRSSNGADESGNAGIRARFGMLVALAFAASGCDDGHAFTAPVASLAPNAFGLHHTVGNVYEWAQDCYRAGHADARADGNADDARDCAGRTMRGGAWSDQPSYLRSAVRIGLPPIYRYHNLGFRLARDP